MATRTVDLDRLKQAVGLSVKITRLGNRKKADIAKIQTEANKDYLGLSKLLIDAKEYTDIVSFLGETTSWVRRRTVPSFFKEGIYMVNDAGVPDIDKYLTESQGKVRDLVEKFITVYPAKVEDAKTKLRDQFRETDYCDPKELRDQFRIRWNWINFKVADQLSEEMKKREIDKMQKDMQDAGDCIVQALRSGFLDLIAKAEENMVIKPGEKPKKFFDSSIEKIVEFIDTFKQRNLTNDVELAALVEQAKQVVGDPKIGEVRKSLDIRTEIGKKFGAIVASMDGMVEIKKTRLITSEES